MLKQTPQSALLLRNRFASWVGGLVLVAAGLYLFNSTAETTSTFSFANVAKDDSAGDTGNAGSDAAIGGNKDGGFAWGDINNDGFLDLAVNTNSNSLGTRILIADNSDPVNPVFRDSTTTFCNDCGTSNRERSALLVDINHDGYVDLIRNTYNGSIGSIAIYFNQGPAGFYHLGTNSNGDPHKIIDYADFHDNKMNVEGVLVLDYNHDGWLDIVAENHNFGIDIFQNPADGSANFVNLDPTLTGLTASAGNGDYAAAVDYDNDGDVDYIARKNNGPDFFISNGDGTYQGGVEIGDASNGNKGGAVFGDLDNDGDYDLYWTDANGNQIWLNEYGTFRPTYDGSNSEPWASAGLTYPSNGIDGCAVGDVNNDGKLDLFLTDDNGTSFLFLNDTPFGGTLSFTQDNAGIDVNANGEGVSFADYDRDGDLDLYINIRNGANQLWRNDFNDAGANDYLFVDARIDLGGGIWRNAVGANIYLEDCDGTRLSGMREVATGSGHGTDAPDQVHFGLPNGANQGYNVVVDFVMKNGARASVSRFVVPADLTDQTLVVYDTDTPIFSYCEDHDLDGIPDTEDLDDDNDGIADLVECAPTNIALSNTVVATASSLYTASTTADRAIDGIVPGTVFHTGDGDSNEWLDIDLGSSQLISEIVISNRTDCCSDRLTNAYVLLASNPFPDSSTDISGALINADFTHQIGNTSGVSSLTIPIDDKARYVRLQLSGTNLGGNIINIYELEVWSPTACDADGDGLSNVYDLDSDNDGIPDLVETGGIDTDGNGKVDCFNGAGVLTDTDADGWCDTYDNTGSSYSSGTPLLNLDQDQDGKPNYLDIDSDNDGITDVVETFGFEADDDPTTGSDGRVDNVVDTDLNGWSDAYANLIPTTADANPSESSNNTLVDFATGIGNPDRDGDGLPNFLDIDADGDGIVDMVEAQASSTNNADIFDGLATYTTTDSDGDGLMDQFDPDEGGSYLEPINTDNTDQVDFLDENADNDSFSDLLEGHDGNGDGNVDRSPTGVDSDLDGLDDAFDTELANHDPEASNQSIQDSDGNLGSGGDRDWREANSSTFPVEWLGFRVDLVGQDAVLNWETAIEINSDKYQVERSVDNQSFEVVAEVKAAGMSDKPLSYTYTDQGVVGLNQSRIYYRIQQVDLDGGFDFSDLVELQLDVEGLTLSLSPNPTSGPLKLSWQGLSEHSSGELQIIDIGGRIIFQQRVAIKDGGLETSLAQHPAGVYVVRLQLEDQVLSKKVQKR